MHVAGIFIPVMQLVRPNRVRAYSKGCVEYASTNLTKKINPKLHLFSKNDGESLCQEFPVE